MACEAITTGNAFLSSALAHIDCQAQTIGSFGFSALSEPGSPVSQILTALLVIFVAIFGLRLLLGYSTGPRDVVTAVLKVGIVLALATSWPAYRTLVYGTVLHGPAELAKAVDETLTHVARPLGNSFGRTYQRTLRASTRRDRPS